MPARRLTISGIVQGVGFRPFIFTLAKELNLVGYVRNTSAGVVIDIQGEHEALEKFEKRLTLEKPSLAQLDSIKSENIAETDFTHFEIEASEAIAGAFQPISPDVATCQDCLTELEDPGDRRYHYPFINCTNCGPRFTIIMDIPYDRPNTTMATFPMCPDCGREYQDPSDRRFHAQPTACPTCGPTIWIEKDGERITLPDPEASIIEAQRMLKEGQIVAIKGLGGFHLACDATNSAAVATLRQRKLRVDKPFALMAADTAAVEEICQVDSNCRVLLESRQRPIVIMAQRENSPIVSEVAPGQQTLGVMLPYTPLHTMLFTALRGNSAPRYLVMTSGNLSEEPIATDNREASERLKDLCDVFLMHNRPIHIRCDDSVVRASPTGGLYPLRRARGYAPQPIRLAQTMPSLLATGPALKNTFALARENYVFLSHHIGDLENYETLRDFEEGIAHYENLFRITPQYLAYDLHPDYLSTRYALARAASEGLPAFGIQHHHAHIAACMAEHGIQANEPVIGLSFDGTGYGTDGAIWGGEILLVSYTGFRRLAHLNYTPLPGGDAAVRRPARTALAYLWAAGVPWEEDLPSTSAYCAQDLHSLRMQLTHKVNTPLTSSMGRLFDAAASIAGVRHVVNYEAQAAIEFEAQVDTHETGRYPFDVPDISGDRPALLDPGPLIQALAAEARRLTPISQISARFHNTIAAIAAECAHKACRLTGINKVALSGGVWQNDTLLRKTLERLRELDIEILIHQQVPANDGGISLGQAVILAHTIQQKGSPF